MPVADNISEFSNCRTAQARLAEGIRFRLAGVLLEHRAKLFTKCLYIFIVAIFLQQFID